MSSNGKEDKLGKRGDKSEFKGYFSRLAVGIPLRHDVYESSSIAGGVELHGRIGVSHYWNEVRGVSYRLLWNAGRRTEDSRSPSSAETLTSGEAIRRHKSALPRDFPGVQSGNLR